MPWKACPESVEGGRIKSGQLFILLFFFQSSFFLWTKHGLFLVFSFAFIFFSTIAHTCCSFSIYAISFNIIIWICGINSRYFLWRQQFRKMWLADCISIVLVVCIYGFMAIWSFCRNMQHLLMGNFGSFCKIWAQRCFCRYPWNTSQLTLFIFITNLHRLNQGGPAPDCLTTALAKSIPNPAYNWFAIAIKLLIVFLICPLRLRS